MDRTDSVTDFALRSIPEPLALLLIEQTASRCPVVISHWQPTPGEYRTVACMRRRPCMEHPTASDEAWRA